MSLSSKFRIVLASLCVLCVFVVNSRAAEPLPNTKPLTEDGDLAAKMVAGIHKYLDRELAPRRPKRDAVWKLDLSSTEKRSPDRSTAEPRTAAEVPRRGR